MHELVERRLKDRGIEYVLFHGGVPGPKRTELINRFRDDPKCRVFLATDAGGVGLNLQFASVVVNLDLPWNPAVLEQRIGRVHRLGQRRPVQAINFVSQGTIEEGMLEVIRFKKSLFAGILDGGDKNVSLGGSRLNKFMEAVEQSTANIPSSTSAAPSQKALDTIGAIETTDDDAVTMSGSNGSTTSPAPAEPTSAADPFAGLLQAGMSFLRQAMEPAQSTSNGSKAAPKPRTGVVRDVETGEPVLQIPVPRPEVVREFATALRLLLQSLRR